MRTAAVIIIGATPGLALGYVLLSAYLLSRIVPLPITQLPRARAAAERAPPPA